ncbi:cysteine-rich receptor-like protein kinase, partial [Trifolium pratense]
MENGQNVTLTEVDQFKRVLGNLMKKLKEKAASSNDSRVKYATDNESNVTLNFQTIYGLVQCTPDLSLQDCMDCLNGAISYLPNSKFGGGVVEPSCNIRYESWRFYDPPFVVVDTDETSQPQEKGKSYHTTIAIVVPAVVAVLVLNL